MKVYLLLVLFLCSYAKASDFNFLKLKPVLQERHNLLQRKVSLKELSHSNKKMRLLLDDSKQVQAQAFSLSASENKGLETSDGQISPIYGKIMELIGGNYQALGEQQAEGIMAFNRQFNLGEQNFSGFTWQKPMGKFAIYANRVIRPYQFTTTWIVDDIFTIYIDASSFLKSMKDEDLIDISEQNMALFAGLSFKREFRYSHLAASYNEALFSDFSKLFLSFNMFSIKPLLNLAPYEIVSKEDSLSASVGGLISSPPIYGFSGAAGVLVTYNHVGRTVVQKLGPEDNAAAGEFLRLSSTKKNALSVGATAQLQLDFLKLVKLTLFSYDFEYEFEKTQTVNLSFYEKDKEKLNAETEERAEFKRLISTFSTQDIKALKGNIVSLDQREQENIDSKFGFLLFGALKKKETEQVKIVKDGETKVFFRTHYENLKTVQNFFSRLLNTVVYALVKFPLGTKLDASKSRQVDIEYEALDNQQKEDIFIESEEKLSVTLQKRYEARDTTGFFKQNYKKHTIELMQNYTSLKADFVSMVRKDELQGPIAIHTTVRIETQGLRYFNQTDVNNVFLHIALICQSKRPTQWQKADSREKFMKRLQVGPELCVKDLGEDYLAYKADYEKYNEINMKKFRNFLIGLHKKTDRINDLYHFFGEKNLFFNGYFSAKTKSGNNFNTFFQDGVYRGLGLIDNYVKGDAWRAPAAIGQE